MPPKAKLRSNSARSAFGYLVEKLGEPSARGLVSRMSVTHGASVTYEDFAHILEALQLLADARSVLQRVIAISDRPVVADFLAEGEAVIDRMKNAGRVVGWSDAWMDQPRFIDDGTRWAMLPFSATVRANARKALENHRRVQTNALDALDELRSHLESLARGGGSSDAIEFLKHSELAGAHMNAKSQESVQTLTRRRAATAAVQWVREYQRENPSSKLSGTTLAYAAIASGVDRPCRADAFEGRESYWSNQLKRAR